MIEASGLVADVGRASVRFALTGGTATLLPQSMRSYPCDAYSTFSAALAAYLADTDMRETRLPAMLALAGVVRGDVLNVTNSRWFISLSGVSSMLMCPARAINDYAAVAFALTVLPEHGFTPLGGGTAARRPCAGGRYVVVGPGTGLGVAGLIDCGSGLIPLPSEAGRMRFAAETPDERRFAEVAARQGERFLCPEALLSGPGLVTAYAALSGRPVATMRPEDVTRLARSDRHAEAAVALFVDHLSAFLGDMVVAFGAWDGVYLTGAIARALGDRLAQGGFRDRMESHGSYSRRMRQVPVTLVQRSDLELVGAAAMLAIHR